MNTDREARLRKRPFSQLLDLRDLWPWPWIGSYGIPSCIDFYHLHTKFRPNGKNFVDGRTPVFAVFVAKKEELYTKTARISR